MERTVDVTFEAQLLQEGIDFALEVAAFEDIGRRIEAIQKASSGAEFQHTPSDTDPQGQASEADGEDNNEQRKRSNI